MFYLVFKTFLWSDTIVFKTRKLGWTDLFPVTLLGQGQSCLILGSLSSAGCVASASDANGWHKYYFCLLKLAVFKTILHTVTFNVVVQIIKFQHKNDQTMKVQTLLFDELTETSSTVNVKNFCFKFWLGTSVVEHILSVHMALGLIHRTPSKLKRRASVLTSD